MYACHCEGDADVLRPKDRCDACHEHEAEVPNVSCRWFAACENTADGVVSHPVLGAVPTCRRCAESLDLNLIAGTFHLDREDRATVTFHSDPAGRQFAWVAGI